MKLKLPYPPSLNALFRTVLIGVCAKCRKHAHATLFKSDEYDDYAVQLRLALLEHSLGEQLVRIAKPTDVAVTAHLYRPRRVGDLDNMFKALLDLLAGHLYEDDAQIAELHAFRHDDKARPRVELEVTELAAPEPAQPSLFDLTTKGAGHAAPPAKAGTQAAAVKPPGAVAAEPLDRKLRRLATPAVITNRDGDS